MPMPNILYIDIDSLRADHLGCYGYPLPTSPCIDRLAAEGVTCESLFACGIPTHPAHATLYTGLHPIAHGIVCHGGAADLSPRTPVLPELLQQAGLTTCAIDNLADSKPWFARGYEFYINPSHRHRMRLMVTAEELNARAVPWLRQHRDERFFLFVHYWDPHTPYLPPARLRGLFYQGSPSAPEHTSLAAVDGQPLGDFWRRHWFDKLAPGLTDADYVRAMYDAEVRYVDEAVGELLDTLEDLGLAEDTLVLVSADHGESLLEHNILFEHHGLYDVTTRVPFIVRWPAGGVVGGRSDSALHDQTDVLPTLLAALGVEPPQGIDGRDLLANLQGSSAAGREEVVCEECTWQMKWALRTRTHKLILAREPDLHGTPPLELFDLRADPGERCNLAEECPELAESLRARLEGWIEERMASTGQTRDPLVAQGMTLGRRYKEIFANARLD